MDKGRSMNEMRHRLKDHFLALPQEEQVELVKKTAQQLHKDFQRKNRAFEAERNAPARSNTPRGGKRTSLAAASQRAAEAYESTKDMLQLYTALLF
jgi:hypothetical protein